MTTHCHMENRRSLKPGNIPFCSDQLRFEPISVRCGLVHERALVVIIVIVAVGRIWALVVVVVVGGSSSRADR